MSDSKEFLINPIYLPVLFIPDLARPLLLPAPLAWINQARLRPRLNEGGKLEVKDKGEG